MQQTHHRDYLVVQVLKNIKRKVYRLRGALMIELTENTICWVFAGQRVLIYRWGEVSAM